MKVFGVVGWKNTGKTGLMERLVAEFCERGFSVSTIKHAHHSFDVDQPGRDSYRHRTAGASEVVLASSERVAIMQELRGAPEPDLQSLIARVSPVDLVLIEGFKSDLHAKIETHRQAAAKPLLFDQIPNVRAIATDTKLDVSHPQFDLDDTRAIADFIAGEVGL
ncbi:MAG: molybdopterin-guanine dinucleotide biosynthesis protein B [Rhodobacteraceae bacterium]|nr:molybdopterin-guanine dinucleotide biosynthesis protein B [Paracoccaceae bacterium]